MPLPRLQLVELEDLTWFPATIRDLATDYLQFMQDRFQLHAPLVPILYSLLEQSKSKQIVDLCSGGGGPVLAIADSLLAAGLRVPIIVTDKYPNTETLSRHAALRPEGILFRSDSIDATRVPDTLTGLRSIFNAFHHFNPRDARAVLESAVQARQPIAIFEIPERSLVMMIPFFFTPLFVAVATPFIRPFHWRRLVWTYLIPLIPLTCWWDGLVSQWRAYTVRELLELTQGLHGYDWTAGRVPIKGLIGHVTFLSGLPRAESA